MSDMTRETVISWIESHGVDRRNIPASAVPEIVVSERPYLRIECFVLDEDGAKVLDEAREEVLTEIRVFPLRAMTP